jgi:hypothetical protein
VVESWLQLDPPDGLADVLDEIDIEIVEHVYKPAANIWANSERKSQ